ncbi:MAG: hypothetical protein ABIC57_04055 [bacterium]
MRENNQLGEITVIIDCNYICYVNRFSLSQGLSYRGKNTEIIFGFLRHINELARKFDTNKFIFCWDSRTSLRKEIYPAYKENRRVDQTSEDKELDQIAYQQFNELKDTVLPRFSFKNIFYKDGYESDDIIASIVKDIPNRYVVVASDNDLFQLLDYCTLYNISTKTLTTKEDFERNHGISSRKWHLVKAIAGCSSDNVSGAKGVGEKTAIKYLNNELKTGVKFAVIQEMYFGDMFNRNIKLVKLPFENTGTFSVNNQDIFYEKDFMEICEQYGMESFLAPKYFQSWIKSFNMK